MIEYISGHDSKLHSIVNRLLFAVLPLWITTIDTRPPSIVGSGLLEAYLVKILFNTSGESSWVKCVSSRNALHMSEVRKWFRQSIWKRTGQPMKNPFPLSDWSICVRMNVKSLDRRLCVLHEREREEVTDSNSRMLTIDYTLS